MLFQMFRIEQFSGKYRFLLILIGVERRNTLLCGTVLFIFQPCLFQAVQFPMPGKKQRCPVADLKLIRCNINALGSHFFDLPDKVFHIECDTVSQDIKFTFTKDAGRKQMQGKLPVLVDHGVSGVTASLKAYDDIILFRQQVDHTALSFIAPVDPNDRTV